MFCLLHNFINDTSCDVSYLDYTDVFAVTDIF